MNTGKRPLGSAGSPPASGPKPKKARPSVGMSRHGSVQTPIASASSPPLNLSIDSPAGSRPRSRSRSRSLSAAPGEGPVKSKKGKQREDTVGPAPDGAEAAAPAEGEAAEDAEDEDEEAAYSDDEFGMNQKDYQRQKEDLRILLEHFDPAQMDRYEAYRRSGLNKASVRKLVNQVLQQSVGPSILTVVRGFAKVFVGEIVENAREVARHPGPLTPADIREAYRRYQATHNENGRPKKLFVR